jgi:hypothetical protein
MVQQTTRMMVAVVAVAALAVAGCHVRQSNSNSGTTSPQPSSTTMPATQAAPSAVADSSTPETAPPPPQVVDSSKPTPPTPPSASSADTLKNVVPPKKPFVATGGWFKTKPDEPSVLLQQHARSDSPVPLSLYDRQPMYALEQFNLRQTLSADEVQKRLGPPAQLADYSDPWLVYRLSNGRELWLHFAQPAGTRLLYADVISHAEDGYIRRRIFSYDGTQ